MKRLVSTIWGFVVITLALPVLILVSAQQQQRNVDVNGILNFTPDQVDAIQTKSIIVADPTERVPGESSTITVTIIGVDDLPMPNQLVSLEITGCSNYTITSPAATDANGQTTAILTANEECTALIRGTVVTVPGQPVPIDDTASVIFAYPLNIFVYMLPEPQFTRGTQNTVYWTMNDAPDTDFEYYVEVSTSPLFTTIIDSTGWIRQTSFTFTNLEHGTTYYYRVRSRPLNTTNPSNWSNIENSTQDTVPPTSRIITVTPQQEYTYVITFDSNDTVSGVNEITLYVSADDGPLIEIGTFPPGTDTTTIDLSTIFSNIEEIRQLNFFIKGIDNVGNEEPLRDGPVLFINEPTPTASPTGSVSPSPTASPTVSSSPLFPFIGELTPENIAQVVNVSLAVTSGALAVGALLGSLPYLIILLQNLAIGSLNLPGIFVFSKEWGFVYNSITKGAVSRAILRLYSADGAKLVRTGITDVRGVFSFRVPTGNYILKVLKNGYEFPSRVVRGQYDPPWKNVYHGEIIKVHRQAELNLAVPIDPIERKESMVWFRRIGTTFWAYLIKLQPVIMVLGFIYSLWALLTFGGILNLVIVILYLILIILRLTQFVTREPNYGLVKTKDKKPLVNIPIGLFESEFDQLISRVYTDEQGQYRFISINQPYTLRVMDPNYRIVNIPKDQPIQNEIHIQPKPKLKQLVVNYPIVVEQVPTEPSKKKPTESTPPAIPATPQAEAQATIDKATEKMKEEIPKMQK